MKEYIVEKSAHQQSVLLEVSPYLVKTCLQYFVHPHFGQVNFLLVIVAAVPLFVVAGMFEMQVWTRVLLMGIGFVIMVMGIAIACVLDREAGAFECPECHNRFVPDMKSYIMGPHTITKRKLVCPHCGAHKYCKKVLTK